MAFPGGNDGDQLDFIRRASPRIDRVLLRDGAGEHDAQDARQQTLVKLFQNWNKIGTSEAERMAWCFRVAHREYVRLKGRDSRDRRLLERLRGAAPRAPGPPDPSEDICRRDPLMQILRRLPARQRTVLALDLEDVSDEDIAHILGGVVPSTVRSLRRNAREGARKIAAEMGMLERLAVNVKEAGPLTKPRPGPEIGVS